MHNSEHCVSLIVTTCFILWLRTNVIYGHFVQNSAAAFAAYNYINAFAEGFGGQISQGLPTDPI
jgi:hypothetical protein